MGTQEGTGMTAPIIQIPTHQQACSLCGGHSRRKVYCSDCLRLFHPICCDHHECDEGYADEAENENA